MNDTLDEQVRGIGMPLHTMKILFGKKEIRQLRLSSPSMPSCVR